jgi:polar amino acid transport system substrate-binding protein
LLNIPIKICGLLILTSSLVVAEPLRFAQMVNTPDQLVGAEVLRVIYAKARLPIEIIPLSGKRALLESSKGRLDGEVHRILEIGSDYPDLIKIPTAINYIEPMVFSKDKDFLLAGCTSLKGKLIGRVRGVKYAELCTKGMNNVAIFSDSGSLMKSLNRNIIDYAITAHFNGLVQLKKLGINSVIALKPPLGKRPLFHYLHKKHKDLIPKLESITSEMAKTGELDLIRQQQIQILLAQTDR